MEEKVKLFKALADPNRLRIIKMLQHRQLCVCEITAVLQLATSTVSKHLSILKEAGFIVENQDGKWVNYTINTSPAEPAIPMLNSMIQMLLEPEPQIKKDHNLVTKVDRITLCK
jgi:ArsR family transcriptional regulator, arsenate/arsenite/antimonite-responsive transcriptional repressor